jgi:hypothetical protein
MVPCWMMRSPGQPYRTRPTRATIQPSGAQAVGAVVENVGCVLVTHTHNCLCTRADLGFQLEAVRLQNRVAIRRQGPNRSGVMGTTSDDVDT